MCKLDHVKNDFSLSKQTLFGTTKNGLLREFQMIFNHGNLFFRNNYL